jgi:hypothetical protein
MSSANIFLLGVMSFANISVVIDDNKLLAFIAFEGKVVGGRGFRDCGRRWDDNRAIAAIKIVSFVFVGDDDEVPDACIHSTVKKDGMRVPKIAFTRRSTPLQPNLRLNRPLPMASRRDYPLTSPLRARGPLIIVTSLIGSTGYERGVQPEKII